MKDTFQTTRRKRDNFYVVYRNRLGSDLRRDHPNAYLLLSLIAERARYSEAENIHGLRFGECMLGDYKAAGIATPAAYRHALKVLKKLGYIETISRKSTTNNATNNATNGTTNNATNGATNGATNRTTNRGTVARLINTGVFDPFRASNDEQNNEQNNEQNDEQSDEQRDERNDERNDDKQEGTKIEPKNEQKIEPKNEQKNEQKSLKASGDAEKTLGSHSFSSDFLRFWNQVPSGFKKKKREVFELWESAIEGGHDPEWIIACAFKFAIIEDSRRDICDGSSDTVYLPGCILKWFEGQRWEDELSDDECYGYENLLAEFREYHRAKESGAKPEPIDRSDARN